MPVYLHAIGTAVPEHLYAQSQIRDVIRAQPELDRLGQRLVTSIFNASAIDQRYSAVGDFHLEPRDGAGLFYDAGTGRMLRPSTGARNAFYAQHAAELFIRAGRAMLEARPDWTAADITHVITVSCTGFFAPGPDYAVVRGLGLSAQTQRFHIGFMGCYAAFPALRMAQAFCEANPQATVLVICAELCTIHMHSASDPDTLIANSVFADGAAAALLSARPPAPGQAALQLDRFGTALTPPGIGEAEMAWTIGDQGFDMILSTYVPEIIGAHLEPAITPMLGPVGLAEIGRWAVHPGGRSILDKVQGSLSLSDEQMRVSRDVLRQYGNMSSATVLFILAALLREAAAGTTSDRERVGALAFGPGLTVEFALMTLHGGQAPEDRA